jgi:hypothetical protein
VNKSTFSASSVICFLSIVKVRRKQKPINKNNVMEIEGALLGRFREV